jgi:hypothetical protein
VIVTVTVIVIVIVIVTVIVIVKVGNAVRKLKVLTNSLTGSRVGLYMSIF